MNCTDKNFHEASQKVFVSVDTLITFIKGIKNVRTYIKYCVVYCKGKKKCKSISDQIGDGIDLIDFIEKMQ